VVPATDGVPARLRALCDEHGLLLIVDEIQTGVGRTGAVRLRARRHAPDIMTLGKGLGGGVPLAALLAKAPVCCFEPGDQGGTFNGNPLMCAVGLAVLDHVGRPGFLKSVAASGLLLEAELQRLSARHGLGRGARQGPACSRSISSGRSDPGSSRGARRRPAAQRAAAGCAALHAGAQRILQMIAMLDDILTRLGAARCVA
jgi:acetylornithine/N-succinyldiaminopimelate aminotransferase